MMIEWAAAAAAAAEANEIVDAMASGDRSDINHPLPVDATQ